MGNQQELNLYTYYVPYRTTEHKLYASEIAQMYYVDSVNGRHHAALVGAVIYDYIHENGIAYEPNFYQTKNGLAEVYSKKIYEPAMENFLNKINRNDSGIQTYTSLRTGKEYKFTIF